MILPVEVRLPADSGYSPPGEGDYPGNKMMLATTWKKRGRMIWGLSLHGWEDVMRGSLAVVGVFGLLVGLATFFVVTLQREEIEQSKRELEEYKIEASEKIAASAATGETAKADAAKAHARALEAQLALEKFKSPRDFPPERQSVLSEKLKKFSDIQFDTGAASTDPEYLFLLDQIVSALIAAGWTIVPWHGGGTTIAGSNPANPNIGVASVAGVAIFVNPDAREDLWPAVIELTAFLNEVGLVTHSGRMAVSGNTNANTIHVMVGSKM